MKTLTKTIWLILLAGVLQGQESVVQRQTGFEKKWAWLTGEVVWVYNAVASGEKISPAEVNRCYRFLHCTKTAMEELKKKFPLVHNSRLDRQEWIAFQRYKFARMKEDTNKLLKMNRPNDVMKKEE